MSAGAQIFRVDFSQHHVLPYQKLEKLKDLSLTVFLHRGHGETGENRENELSEMSKGLLSCVKSGSDSLGHNRNKVEFCLPHSNSLA